MGHMQGYMYSRAGRSEHCKFLTVGKGRKYLTEREVEQLMTQTCYSTGH